MIRAVIFDLDGTLVQTEVLKARSYASAAVELCPQLITEEEVIEVFKDVVGLSRREVVQKLMARFNLEAAARARMKEYDVSTPWQVFIQVRMKIYQSVLDDPQILHDHLCPYNVKLLNYSRGKGFQTGLATMSYCLQAIKILTILRLKDKFDFIASRDDVEKGKPDPEIYLLVAGQLDVSPEHCLVIEDSPTGVKAALAAGMHCICVTTDFTRKAIHNSGLLEKRWIVDDSRNLLSVAQQLLGN